MYASRPAQQRGCACVPHVCLPCPPLTGSKVTAVDDALTRTGIWGVGYGRLYNHVLLSEALLLVAAEKSGSTCEEVCVCVFTECALTDDDSWTRSRAGGGPCSRSNVKPSSHTYHGRCRMPTQQRPASRRWRTKPCPLIAALLLRLLLLLLLLLLRLRPCRCGFHVAAVAFANRYVPPAPFKRCDAQRDSQRICKKGDHLVPEHKFASAKFKTCLQCTARQSMYTYVLQCLPLTDVQRLGGKRPSQRRHRRPKGSHSVTMPCCEQPSASWG